MPLSSFRSLAASGALLAAALAPAAVAQAQPVSVSAPMGPAEVFVGYAGEFAEELPELGEREGERLTEIIVSALDRELRKRPAPITRIDVTILEATPNRPTFEQLGDRPSLDPLRSFGLGGMTLEGAAIGPSGEVIARERVRWFGNDIRNARFESTWGDARFAARQFARRIVKASS